MCKFGVSEFVCVSLVCVCVSVVCVCVGAYKLGVSERVGVSEFGVCVCVKWCVVCVCVSSCLKEFDHLRTPTC